jgi:hypothetical protein
MGNFRCWYHCGLLLHISVAVHCTPSVASSGVRPPCCLDHDCDHTLGTRSLEGRRLSCARARRMYWGPHRAAQAMQMAGTHRQTRRRRCVACGARRDGASILIVIGCCPHATDRVRTPRHGPIRDADCRFPPVGALCTRPEDLDARAGPRAPALDHEHREQ